MDRPLRKCNQCKEPATIGTRCFRHYVLVLARERNLLRYKWFRWRIDKFVSMLLGRYLIITGGSEPIPAWDLIKLVWTDDPRPNWTRRKNTTDHRPQGGGIRSRSELHSLIAAVEQRAREDRHASDNCR